MTEIKLCDHALGAIAGALIGDAAAPVEMYYSKICGKERSEISKIIS